MIKGYITSSGYMGYVSCLSRYILFASESDYIEYIGEGSQ